MVKNKKFYVTANRILDVDAVSDVQYFPVGSPAYHDILHDSTTKPGVREKSEFRLVFKKHGAEGITLFGVDADSAWIQYTTAVNPSA